MAAHRRRRWPSWCVPKSALDHKRSVGTVLVVGGSKGMTGAAHMAAFAALRGGAGLVHVALPDGASAQKPYAEVITVEVPGEDGQFGTRRPVGALRAGRRLKAVAVGPGLGRTDGAQAARQGADRPGPCRCCWTPTACTRSATKLELLAERTAPTVLTPHEGELGRLLGRPADEVAAQRARVRRLRRAARQRRPWCSRARRPSSPTRRAGPTSSRSATPASPRRARATC